MHMLLYVYTYIHIHICLHVLMVFRSKSTPQRWLNLGPGPLTNLALALKAEPETLGNKDWVPWWGEAQVTQVSEAMIDSDRWP